MLDLTLTLDQKDVVTVHANGSESHAFPLHGLALTETDVASFFDSPSVYGQRLFQAVFQENSVALDALNALPHTLSAEGRIALRLENDKLNELPWEYLHDSKNYLVVERAFTRVTAGAQPADPSPQERLHFLFIPSDPLLHDGNPPPYNLGVDAEWDELVIALDELDPAVDLEKIQPTFKALQGKLAGKRNAIVHFTGHGDLKNGVAHLLFEKNSGTADAVPATQVSAQWRGRAALVVLSACLSAVPGEGPEANLARLLCEQGAPFVLGMQMVVSDIAARQFTSMFYRYLLAGEDIFEAVRQARLSILSEAGPHSEIAMGIPVLYTSDTAGAGILRPAGNGLDARDLPRPILEGLPTIESGFFGRHHELVEIGEHFSMERPRAGETHPPLTVTLHGPGGIGKTALLVKAAERFAWKFKGVHAVALEPLPSPEALLERLEKALGIKADPAWGSETRLDNVSRRLQGQNLLLALDNFESVFRATGEKKAEASVLYKFFEGLPARGVTLLISSRETTNLPGEHIVEVRGLDGYYGGRLFSELIHKRRAELDERSCQLASRAVGGHPLAIRLVAPVFDGGEGWDLADFLANLDDTLRTAAKTMADGKRHDTLYACFDFSLAHFTHSAPELVDGIARLSEFYGTFPDWLAAPALFGREKIFENDESQGKAFKDAAKLLHRLYDGGLLEREILPTSEDDSLTFYSLHPALQPFAAERLDETMKASAEDGYFLSMQHLGRICHPASEGGGIHARFNLALTAFRALPDLRHAAGLRTDSEGSNLCYHAAFILTHFGDLDGAMKMYQQALEIDEGLGDLQGKSATLHAMAGILRVRGDLDGAMKMYQQSLEIKEGLGDLQGKSATLHEMAGIFVTRGDLDGAMKMYQQARDILEGLGDLKGKSATLHAMAYILRVRGDLDGAMKMYQQARDILEGLGDLQGKSATLYAMAYILRVRGDLDGAMKMYQQAFEIKEGLGDLQGKSATLHAMAYIFVTRGDLDGAMKMYQQARDILEGLGDLQGKSATLQAMADIFVTRGDLDGAMKMYQQALEIDEGLGDLKGKSATLQATAYIFVTRGDLDGAMKMYQQARDILEGLGDLQGKSATLHAMAGIFVTRGDLDGAMKMYQQARDILEGLGDLQGKSATLNAMAGILRVRGDLDGAMKMYQQALEIDEGLGDLQGKSATLHAMAGILRVRGDLDGAMKMYQQSLEIKEGLGDLQGKSATLHEMAGIFVTRGDLDGAMKMYQQARDILEGLGDLKGKSATLHAMAGIFVTRGDLDGAMKMYQQARDILEGLGDLQGKAMTFGMMSKIYWARQSYGDAITSLLKGLMQLVELKIEPSTQQAMVSDMASWRHELGTEKFDLLWREITNSPLPDWLSQPPQQEQGMTAEQFIAGAIQAAAGKKARSPAVQRSRRQNGGRFQCTRRTARLGKSSTKDHDRRYKS
jgi:tetratricopeptide (TPR) repeat protein/CHAT domain-containing protein